MLRLVFLCSSWKSVYFTPADLEILNFKHKRQNLKLKNSVLFYAQEGASLVAQLVRIRLKYRRPWFDPWVRKIPGRRKRLPTPVFWPGESHGLYSPLGHKESDTTEQLSLSCMGRCKSQRSLNHILNQLGPVILHSQDFLKVHHRKW